MNSPRLAAASVLAIVEANKVPRDRYPVCVVAIRGYRLDSVGEAGRNDRGYFDDAMFVVAPAPGGGDMVMAWNGNTDPTPRWRRRVATLCPGIHIFGTGKHPISRPGGYPAFRQAEVFTVTRDGYGGRRFRGFFGINLHCAAGWFGSFGRTSSLACQTVPKPDWPEFQPTLYALLEQHGNELGRTDVQLWDRSLQPVPTFPYILLNETARRAGALVVSRRYHPKEP